MDERVFKESQPEIMVGVALGMDDLGSVEPGENEAGGRHCGQTAWVGGNGLQYSLLDDRYTGHNGAG